MSHLVRRSASKSCGEGAPQVRPPTGVDRSIGEDHLAAMTGRRESGPSTLPTIPSSLEVPTTGEMVIGATSIAHTSRVHAARVGRRTSGSVFPDVNWLPGLSTVENLARAPFAARMAVPGRFGQADGAEHFPERLPEGEHQHAPAASAVVGNRRHLENEPFGNFVPSIIEAEMPIIQYVSGRGGDVAVDGARGAHVASWVSRVMPPRDCHWFDHVRPALPQSFGTPRPGDGSVGPATVRESR